MEVENTTSILANVVKLYRKNFLIFGIWIRLVYWKKIANIFPFCRIRFKRQVDNSLVVHNPELDFTDDDKMNMKFDIDLDLNQLLNETQMEDNEFPITVIHIW